MKAVHDNQEDTQEEMLDAIQDQLKDEEQHNHQAAATQQTQIVVNPKVVKQKHVKWINTYTDLLSLANRFVAPKPSMQHPNITTSSLDVTPTFKDKWAAAQALILEAKMQDHIGDLKSFVQPWYIRINVTDKSYLYYDTFKRIPHFSPC